MIYKRISNRLSFGTIDYERVMHLIEMKAAIEANYVNSLKQLIEGIETQDSMYKAVVKQIETEIMLYDSHSTQIKDEVIPPQKVAIHKFKDRQAEILKKINNDVYKIQPAIDDVNKSYQYFEVEKERIDQYIGPKRTKQEKRARDFYTEYQKKVAYLEQISMKSQQEIVPPLHHMFLEYDVQRLTQYRNLILDYVICGKVLTKSIKLGYQNLLAKMNNFDTNDRCVRYVSRVFDTTMKDELPVTDDDPELYAIAVADYKSDEPRDLSFTRGDKIKVTNQHGSGWWEGEFQGRKGLFPRNFISLPDDVDVKNEPINAIFLVTVDHKKERVGELDLLSGDLVIVDYLNHGRCSGKNLRNNQRGYFPIDILERKL